MAINRRKEIYRVDRAAGMLLLFETGMRPDAKSVRKAVEKIATIAVGHDPAHRDLQPAAHIGHRQEKCWLEMVSYGLTFHLTHLAPGRSAKIPKVHSRFNCPDSLIEGDCECISLVPGPHLSGSSGNVPIGRVMFGIAADLARQLSGVCAIFWPPSAALMESASFRDTVANWVSGGEFPAQGLTGFRSMTDGALQTEGLAFFTGQEIRMEPDSTVDRSVSIQLAGQLVQQLVHEGPLTRTGTATAPDGGKMRLEPSRNGKFVRVWRCGI